MLHLTRSGKVIEASVKSHKEWSRILACVLVIGAGVGLHLMLDANPWIIAGTKAILINIGMAIWNMLCDAANACADFVHYVMNTRSK